MRGSFPEAMLRVEYARAHRLPPHTVLEPDGPRAHGHHRRGDRGRPRRRGDGLRLGLDRPPLAVAPDGVAAPDRDAEPASAGSGRDAAQDLDAAAAAAEPRGRRRKRRHARSHQPRPPGRRCRDRLSRARARGGGPQAQGPRAQARGVAGGDEAALARRRGHLRRRLHDAPRGAPGAAAAPASAPAARNGRPERRRDTAGGAPGRRGLLRPPGDLGRRRAPGLRLSRGARAAGAGHAGHRLCLAQPDRRGQQGSGAGGRARLSRTDVRDVPELADAGAEHGPARARLRHEPRRLDDQRHAARVPGDDRAGARAGPRRDRLHHLQPAARGEGAYRVPPDDRRRDRPSRGRARPLTVLRPFTLHRPETADEACALLARLGEDSAAYAGGTELLLMMKLGLLRPRHLVDVKRIRGFGEIGLESHLGPRGPSPATAGGANSEGTRLTIGAAVTHRALERSPLVDARCPLVSSVARHVANVRVRNVGTVGGNLAFADPHSDLATLFLTLDASVELLSPRGRRELPLDDFIRGPWETSRAPDELLGSVTLIPWAGDTAAAYVKFGVHERPTLAVATALRLDGADPSGARSSGGSVRVADARVAIGCVSPRPARAPAAEARLVGVAIAELEDVAGAAAESAAATVDPADDLYGSADYKREMVAVFVRRALRIAAARARGAEPTARFQHAVVA